MLLGSHRRICGARRLMVRVDRGLSCAIFLGVKGCLRWQERPRDRVLHYRARPFWKGPRKRYVYLESDAPPNLLVGGGPMCTANTGLGCDDVRLTVEGLGSVHGPGLCINIARFNECILSIKTASA